jgi:hypothetical protein
MKESEPLHLIISLPLYKAIKYNQGLQPDNATISEADIKEFDKFKFLFRELLTKLNSHDSTAFTVLSGIMNMWGYSRKYCGMCGKPIIGKPGHIENRLVCGSCNESYRITEALFHKRPEEEIDSGRRFVHERSAPKTKPPGPRISPTNFPDSDPN